MFEIHLAGKKLAAAAVLLTGGILALASAAMQGGAGISSANPQATVDAMLAQTDHVQPVELARWILDKRADYQLIDLRDPWEFDDYHIPTAINIPLSQLFTAEGLNRLERSKKIVVYGLGAGHPAQTQLLLSMKGYQALSLKEGITAWWDQVMTPQSLRGEEPQSAGYQQSRALRDQFMGGSSPRKSGAAAPAMPAPSAPAPGGAAPKKLKLGRGCS
ncbi:MAG: rhodanese-like domain-containing protein [Acidobacteria bacterium]|nr:rhodanese-like domain-containing protein [Acidobacteriota bacterium]